jgi:hypothetical protein
MEVKNKIETVRIPNELLQMNTKQKKENPELHFNVDWCEDETIEYTVSLDGYFCKEIWVKKGIKWDMNHLDPLSIIKNVILETNLSNEVMRLNVEIIEGKVKNIVPIKIEKIIS